MSKWIEEIEDGCYHITLDDEERCRHLYNEVCTNDASEYVADYPGEVHCEKCPYFEQEDMEEAETWVNSKT